MDASELETLIQGRIGAAIALERERLALLAEGYGYTDLAEEIRSYGKDDEQGGA